jgi:Na+/H+-dicarboxylate symporter
MNIRNFLTLPVFVLAMFVCTLFFGENIGPALKSQLYALSLLLKDLIVYVLPALIFSFVFNGILQLKNESLKVILVLVPLVCLSNFAGFWMSYICATPVLKTGLIKISQLKTQQQLIPAWNYELAPLIKNDIALLLGVIVGILGNFAKTPIVDHINKVLNKCAGFILKKLIGPILPLFVMGFIIKMQYEGTLSLIIREYSALLALVTFLAYGYMFCIVFLLSGRKLSTTLTKIKNMLPAVLIGLCSMSSAAAIPITITGSRKNLQNADIANFVVPATANMHLLGDCFAIPVIGLALIVSFGQELPSLSQYFIFTLYGVLAKFAAAGIPGGSALVFVPIFESILGFNAPMLTAVTARYVLFDPIATSSNVFGHGVYAMLFEKVYRKVFRKL